MRERSEILERVEECREEIGHIDRMYEKGEIGLEKFARMRGRKQEQIRVLLYALGEISWFDVLTCKEF